MKVRKISLVNNEIIEQLGRLWPFVWSGWCGTSVLWVVIITLIGLKCQSNLWCENYWVWLTEEKRWFSCSLETLLLTGTELRNLARFSSSSPQPSASVLDQRDSFLQPDSCGVSRAAAMPEFEAVTGDRLKSKKKYTKRQWWTQASTLCWCSYICDVNWQIL